MIRDVLIEAASLAAVSAFVGALIMWAALLTGHLPI